MRASVLLKGPDGTRHELGHGDIIGRLWTAAMRVDDARVSEAHALVSLRGGELKLLALRALFAVEGEPLRELTLEPGQQFELARGLLVTVEEVSLPGSVLALEMPGLATQPLPGACWLLTTPHPRLVSRYTRGARASFWSTGEGWRVRVGDREAEDLHPGWSVDIDGATLRAVAQDTTQVGGQATRLGGRVNAPLRIVCHYDTVVIERDGVTAMTLAGQGARLVSELVEVGVPLEWEPLARQLWPEEPEAMLLRRRLDTVMGRLRRKLRSRSLRPDLVRADGSGKFLLHLEAGDEAVLE